MKKFFKNKKILISSLIIIIAIFVVFFYNNSKFISKVDLKKDYVYTGFMYDREDNDYFEIPVINLDGEKFDKLNKAIKDNYDEISNVEDYDYDYEYSISKNILALKITYSYYQNDIEKESTRYFQTFHIDLKTGRILSDDDILNIYGIDKKYADEKIGEMFKKYYSDLVVGKFYTEEECDYKCFLSNRGITNDYLDGASYYIQDGVLTAFKFYYSSSDYLEQQYFENKDYQFIIKE